MKFKLMRVVSPLAGGGGKGSAKAHRRSRYGTLAFPPISLGILSRHLRDCGFHLDQDDLHRRWYSSASAEDTERLFRIAEDEQRMWRYVEGDEDQDWEWFGNKVTDLSDLVEPDVFLLSVISSDLGCCVSTLAFARYLKQRFGKLIILGGEYFAYAPIYDEIDRVLSLGLLDYYILGFGEEPLQCLLRILSGQAPCDEVFDVQGLCWLEEGRVCKNPMIPIHTVVPPDFQGLPIDLYRWSAECPPPDKNLPAPEGELTLPFHLSTGCPYNCAFCECSGMSKASVLSPRQTVEELRKIIDQTGCQTFFFLDNTLNPSPRYINELCDRIIEARLGIQWMDCASCNKMDRDTLEKMREAGVIRIVWGLESGSNRILEYVDKPVRLAQVSNVLRLAHEVGIWNGVEIIVGMPTENEDDITQTMNFLASHAEVLDEVWTYQFYLNRNSAMFRNQARYGLENVRRVNIGLTKDKVYGVVATTHIFDEKDGLRWQEKEKQQKRRVGEMLEHVAALRLYPMSWEHEQQPNLLSWCYRHCPTKADVRQVYHQYWEKLYLTRTWDRQVDTVEALVEEIYAEHAGRAGTKNPNQILPSIYPDSWLPFSAAPEPTEDLNFERSLLMTGRYHDWLIYKRLKERLPTALEAASQSTAKVI